MRSYEPSYNSRGLYFHVNLQLQKFVTVFKFVFVCSAAKTGYTVDTITFLGWKI